MCVCVCVCIFIYIHTHTHTHAYKDSQTFFWWIYLGNDLKSPGPLKTCMLSWQFYMSSLCLSVFSLKKMKVTFTWGTLHYRLNTSLFIVEHRTGVLFKTPAQVELQQGLVCWQQWMRLEELCVCLCVLVCMHVRVRGLIGSRSCALALLTLFMP